MAYPSSPRAPSIGMPFLPSPLCPATGIGLVMTFPSPLLPATIRQGPCHEEARARVGARRGPEAPFSPPSFIPPSSSPSPPLRFLTPLNTAGKGRAMTKKQLEWRAELPHAALKSARLHLDF